MWNYVYLMIITRFHKFHLNSNLQQLREFPEIDFNLITELKSQHKR